MIFLKTSMKLKRFQCLAAFLALKPHEFLSYLQNFSEKHLPDSVVGNDAWLRAGLPVPAEETIRRNNWALVCKYMSNVGRSGGAKSRSAFSAVYVPHPNHLNDIPKTICFQNEGKEVELRALPVSPHELCSPAIMSHQRICILALEIADDDDTTFDLRHIFLCLHNLYHSMARVSIIILLCNGTNPGQRFKSELEVRDEISGQVRSEIDRLNELFKKETLPKSESQTSSTPPLSQSAVSVDSVPGRSLLESCIDDVKGKIQTLQKSDEIIAKIGRVPTDSTVAEQFWEDVCCNPQYASIHRQSKKLWMLNRKLNALNSRCMSKPVRAIISPSESRDPAPTLRRPTFTERNYQLEGSLLSFRGIEEALDTEAVTRLLEIEVSRRNESIPKFFEIIQECVRQGFSLKKKYKKDAFTKSDILSIVKALDAKNDLFATNFNTLHSFKMSEIPEPDLWEALLYCSSLGDCFVINNSFFPDASFVRTHLALVFKQQFTKDSSPVFNEALTNLFDLSSVISGQRTPSVMAPFKSSGKQMWVRSATDPVGVFTKDFALQLKHWKDIVDSKSILKDCMRFFEDCGVLVPYFHYELEHGQLKWHISPQGTSLKEDEPEPLPETMNAFYTLNVAPTSLIIRCWAVMRSDSREADELLKFSNASPNVIEIARDRAVCRLILQYFPDHGLVAAPDEARDCNIMMLTKGLQEGTNASTAECAKAGAILHVSCSKNDSALFRFCIEGLEQVLKAWYPDFSKDVYMSCFVPDLDFKSFFGMQMPLSRIFDQNACKRLSLENDRHVALNDLFPRTCSIFLSHVYEGDGTSHFTDMLKDFLERRFICSVWYDKSTFGEHNEFHEQMKRGLYEASSVIICLTPLYLTRPNCLRELRWALDLRDAYTKGPQSRNLKICILPLHPALTFAGRQAIKEHRCVMLPMYQDTSTPRSEDRVIVHVLSDEALTLLNRLEAMGCFNDFIDAMPWRSDFADWSGDVPEFDLSCVSADVPRNVSDFIKNPKAKRVQDLMDSFCTSGEFSKSFKSPPIPMAASSLPDYFVNLNTDNLHSKPKSLQSQVQVEIVVSDLFKKFCKKDESSFAKSLFAHQDMYLLAMMGFTDDQLVQLLDFPISFRETGQFNRHPKIDVWLRKSALLALSREFSEKLKQSKSNSQQLIQQQQPVAQTVAAVRKGSANVGGLRESDVNDGVAPRQRGAGAGSVSNESQSSRLLGTDPALALHTTNLVTAELKCLTQAIEKIFQAMKSKESEEVRIQLQAKDQELAAAQSALQVCSRLRIVAPPAVHFLTLYSAEGEIGSGRVESDVPAAAVEERGSRGTQQPTSSEGSGACCRAISTAGLQPTAYCCATRSAFLDPLFCRGRDRQRQS
jgi:hypothetical protein